MVYKRQANIWPCTTPVKQCGPSSRLTPIQSNKIPHVPPLVFTVRVLQGRRLFSFLVSKLPCIPNYHYLGGLCRVHKTGLVSEALSS